MAVAGSAVVAHTEADHSSAAVGSDVENGDLGPAVDHSNVVGRSSDSAGAAVGCPTAPAGVHSTALDFPSAVAAGDHCHSYALAAVEDYCHSNEHFVVGEYFHFHEHFDNVGENSHSNERSVAVDVVEECCHSNEPVVAVVGHSYLPVGHSNLPVVDCSTPVGAVGCSMHLVVGPSTVVSGNWCAPACYPSCCCLANLDPAAGYGSCLVQYCQLQCQLQQRLSGHLQNVLGWPSAWD